MSSPAGGNRASREEVAAHTREARSGIGIRTRTGRPAESVKSSCWCAWNELESIGRRSALGVAIETHRASSSHGP